MALYWLCYRLDLRWAVQYTERWRRPMRLTFYTGIACVILQQPAYSIDRLKCGGTEPFWDARLSDGQVVFDPSGGGERRIIYRTPLYTAAAGRPLDFVMSVRAKRGNSTLIGFVVNENRMKERQGPFGC